MEQYKQDRILTAEEVAKQIRIDRSGVYRLAKSGKLKSYLIGGRRMFKESDVLSFFDNQEDRGYVFGKEN